MLHLKLIISALLVAGCLFNVDGFPTDPNNAESSKGSGYFGYAKSFASRGAGLLGSGLSAGAGVVGSGLSAGAGVVTGSSTNPNSTPKAGQSESSGYLGYAKSFASRGAGAVGSGLSAGAGAVGSGLSAGAGAVGSGLTAGAGAVGSGLTAGAGAVGSGLAAGAGAVGSGLSAGAGAVGGGLSAGAGMIGSGISARTALDWSGIVSGLGAGTQYTLEMLSNALSSVNTESLTAALGLPDLSKTIKESVDLYNILPKLLMGQGQSGEGGMNYETAIVFLEKLSVKVPSLKTTADAFKTVSYVMNKMQQLKGKGNKIDPAALMKEAMNVYLKDVDEVLKKKLIDISPLVYDAAFGDKEAARKIAYALADRDTFLKALKGMGYGSQIDLIKTVIDQVSSYANLISSGGAGNGTNTSLASRGAGMVGNALWAGAGKLGSGLSAGAGMVGSGLSASADMTWSEIASTLGASTQNAVHRLANSLSSVNTETLTAALGLPADLSKAIAEKVDIYGILPKLIMGQGQSEEGGMNYDTAIVFLEKLSVIVPSLKTTADAFKIVSYVMNKMQQLQSEGKTIDSETIMKEAVNDYFKDADEVFKKKLIAIAPLVYDAAFGDKDAPQKIAYALADRETFLHALKGMGYADQIELIKTVIDQVTSYATLVKSADDAAASDGTSLASRGAGMLGNALWAGAGMLGNGLSAGAGAVGSGLSASADMTWGEIASSLGAGTQTAVHRLANSLKSVNSQSLTAALGMPADFTKALAEKVDLSSILPKIIMGQGQSDGSGMNYETAMVFLEKLALMVPSLKKTADAFRTVSYVMNKIKKLQSEGKPVDSVILMKEAVDIYFMDVDPAFKQKLIDVSPMVYAAAFGDMDAAYKVANALADRQTVIQALRGMGYGRQITIIKAVIDQVSNYAALVKTVDEAAQHSIKS